MWIYNLSPRCDSHGSIRPPYLWGALSHTRTHVCRCNTVHPLPVAHTIHPKNNSDIYSLVPRRPGFSSRRQRSLNTQNRRWLQRLWAGGGRKDSYYRSLQEALLWCEALRQCWRNNKWSKAFDVMMVVKTETRLEINRGLSEEARASSCCYKTPSVSVFDVWFEGKIRKMFREKDEYRELIIARAFSPRSLCSLITPGPAHLFSTIRCD